MNGLQRPKIIAFYSYKGGTGRSFALAHTAWALAREGRRIILIDLDLAAPSLWALLGQEPTRGFVEYVRGLTIGAPPDVRELVNEVSLDSRASGALYLLQAGSLDKEYLETLQALDWHALVHPQPPRSRAPESLFDLVTPFEELFNSLTEQLRPDAILLDAPTGFNDTSNLCLRVLADLVVAIFAPMRVQLEGISKVVSLLIAEQQARSQKGESARPDVFTAATTIQLVRVGGPQMRRIQGAFEYLDRVRYETLGKPTELTGEIEDLVHQEPAIITYDERLAELENLPTSQEPRETHFAVFQDVINYVQEALPLSRPRVVLTRVTKPNLLDDLEPFYVLVAEQEQDKLREGLFLRTHHVDEFGKPRVVVVQGGKGSGKSALFTYMTTKDPSAVPIHGPGIGFLPDLLCNLQDRAADQMDVFWRLYLLSRLQDTPELPDKEVRAAVANLRALPSNLAALSLFVQCLQTPEMAVRVNTVWTHLDDQFGKQGRRIFLCLDGLDAAFKADVNRREKGLVALFVAWQATFSRLHHLELKVFLRTDLWQRLSFPEKSHLRGREMKLTWDERNLWQLVVKRALSAPRFKDLCETSLPGPVIREGEVEAIGKQDLHPYLDLLFEPRIWSGKTALSRNWITRRLQDAKGAIFPRDLVCLLQEGFRGERDRLSEPRRTSEASVISRESLSNALGPTSQQRVQALREEYPELGPLLDALTGLSSQGPLEELTTRLQGKSDAIPAEKAVDILIEAGVIQVKEILYQVPDLYRHGLQMSRPGPR